MILNVYQGNDNNIKNGQGYKIGTNGSFSYDNTEIGGHSMDLYVTGDRNDIMLSQGLANSYSGHDMDVNVIQTITIFMLYKNTIVAKI